MIQLEEKSIMFGRIVSLLVVAAVVFGGVPYKIKAQKRADQYLKPFVESSLQFSGSLDTLLNKEDVILEPELHEIQRKMTHFIDTALDLENTYFSEIKNFDRFRSALNHMQNRFRAIYQAYQEGKQLYPSEYTFFYRINDSVNKLLGQIQNKDGEFRREVYNKNYFSQAMMEFVNGVTSREKLQMDS